MNLAPGQCPYCYFFTHTSSCPMRPWWTRVVVMMTLLLTVGCGDVTTVDDSALGASDGGAEDHRAGIDPSDAVVRAEDGDRDVGTPETHPPVDAGASLPVCTFALAQEGAPCERPACPQYKGADCEYNRVWCDCGPTPRP